MVLFETGFEVVAVKAEEESKQYLTAVVGYYLQRGRYWSFPRLDSLVEFVG